MDWDDRNVAYDLLTKVYSEFFKQMRREPNLLILSNDELEEIWEKDWDELRNPVLNLIEEAFEELAK